MITYEEAKSKAMELWDEVNYCTEYSDAYVFSKKDDLSIGGNGPVAVMKNTGECLNYTYYLDISNAMKEISERYI